MILNSYIGIDFLEVEYLRSTDSEMFKLLSVSVISTFAYLKLYLFIVHNR